MNHLVDIIIPTYDNYDYLARALSSLITTRSAENLFHITVVNNGHPDSCNWIESPFVTVIQSGGVNLGWEGALKLALTQLDAPYVCFFNDDAHIPPASRLWLTQLLNHFKDEAVGAVGPSSNVVMGMQSIFANPEFDIYYARFLIGFCLLVRRRALDEVGGVDDSLPGGDDLDLSIRLRKQGYRLVADRSVFVYHHGFKTGERVHGTSDNALGWNGWGFKERTDLALIRKHGFRAWWDTQQGVYLFDTVENHASPKEHEADIEGRLIRGRLPDSGIILDLGCGANKTVKHAIGVDFVPGEATIETLTGNPQSQADVIADVAKPLPFDEKSTDVIIARHILEHMLDPITTIRQWAHVLKPGGRLIIAVPLEGLVRSITMNVEHVHAWDMPAMQTLLESAGLSVVEQLEAGNGVSFITIAEKGGQ